MTDDPTRYHSSGIAWADMESGGYGYELPGIPPVEPIEIKFTPGPRALEFEREGLAVLLKQLGDS